MGIEIESRVFSRTSVLDQHTTTDVFVDPGYTLTGGGAWVNYEEPGNLLVQSSPVQDQNGIWSGWVGNGKDVWAASKAKITVYAIGIKVIKDGQAVAIAQTVFMAEHGMANLPINPEAESWVGVGGGVKCEQNIFENVLLSETAPFRGDHEIDEIHHKISTWYGNKQFCFSPTSNRGPTGGGGISTFLIAIRAASVSFNTRIHCAESEIVSRPEVEVIADHGVVVSGGAFSKQIAIANSETNDSSEPTVNLLTATYPLYDDASPDRILGWKVAGKDHHYSSPSKVKAYAVTLTAEESK